MQNAVRLDFSSSPQPCTGVGFRFIGVETETWQLHKVNVELANGSLGSDSAMSVSRSSGLRASHSSVRAGVRKQAAHLDSGLLRNLQVSPELSPQAALSHQGLLTVPWCSCRPNTAELPPAAGPFPHACTHSRRRPDGTTALKTSHPMSDLSFQQFLSQKTQGTRNIHSHILITQKFSAKSQC